MGAPNGVGSSQANGPQPTQGDEDDSPTVELDDFPRPLGIDNRTSPLFLDLVQMVFVRIEGMIGEKKKPGKPYRTKRDVLWEYFSGWRKHVGPDTYPVVRLLLPDRDTRRGNYNLKEQKLAKALLKTMGMSTEIKDARALINWRVPDMSDHHSSRPQKGAGDFASVAFAVIDARSTAKENGEPKMTIDEINALLDRLVVAGAAQRGIVNRAANTSTKASGSTQEKTNASSLDQVADVLTMAYERLSPIEFKWLIRIILRDLKVSMSERVVLGAMHPDAVDLFNTCSDILRVCWELHDPNKRLESEHKEMTVGRVFSPMLCGRLLKSGFDSVVQKMRADRPTSPEEPKGSTEMKYWCKPKEFLIEEKFDGERIQVHKIGDMYTYYSRKSTDYTHLYGQNPRKGSITPFIHDKFNPDVLEAVLDAEMLVWDPQNSVYVPFGQLKSFAAKTSFGPDDPRPCLKVFDVLYIRTPKGCQSLLKTALWKRKALIHKVIQAPVPGVLEIAEVKKISTAEEISDFLKVMLEERGEGMVVKNPYSIYQLGGRELTWLKIKPDYMDQLGTDLDALVVGAYWGQGRRGGTHASFMLGVRDDSREEDGKPFFRSFAKVGTGFNRDLFQSIRDQTQGKWFDYNRRKLPDWFSTNSEAPDQLIHPKDSFVVTVKAAEVVLGKDYGAGWTLRFPRCMGVRDDKDWTDSATLSELEEVQAGSAKRSQDSQFTSEGKKRKTTRTTKPTGMVPVVKVEKVDELFKGMVFYVHHMRHFDRGEIHAKIKAHGGAFRQAPSALAGVDGVEERLIVATEWKNALTRMQAAKDYDTISPKWIVDSIEAGERMTLTSKYYVNCLESTRSTLAALDQRDEMLRKGSASRIFSPSPSPAPSPAPSALPSTSSKEVEMLSPKQEEEEEEESSFTAMHHEMADSDDDSDDSNGEDRFQDGIHDESGDDDDDDDDGEDVKEVKEEKEDVKPKTESSSPSASARQSNGANELGEAHYDPDSLFGQYVAYFDTSSNAMDNNLSASQKVGASQTTADEELTKVQKLWTGNGGRTTDYLFDPELTHIILDAKIKDRISEMIDCTSEPRYRHLVTAAWIEECVDAEALVDEQDFRP